MSLKSRLKKLEAVAVPVDLPPLRIEQDAPGAPVRFRMHGEDHEMSAEELRRRWPDARFLKWYDQPWAGEV